MDRIEVTGIRAWGHHGVLPHEAELGQEFVVDLVVEVDLARAGSSDDLEDTIDYGELSRRVVDLVVGPRFQLIEALAARIADGVLAHPLAHAVTVTVRKPSAPFPVPVAEAAVTIERRA
jgi:dihydroneopterin aldolase